MCSLSESQKGLNFCPHKDAEYCPEDWISTEHHAQFPLKLTPSLFCKVEIPLHVESQHICKMKFFKGIWFCTELLLWKSLNSCPDMAGQYLPTFSHADSGTHCAPILKIVPAMKQLLPLHGEFFWHAQSVLEIPASWPLYHLQNVFSHLLRWLTGLGNSYSRMWRRS